MSRTPASTEPSPPRWSGSHALASVALLSASLAGLLAAADPVPARVAVVAAVAAAAVLPLLADGLVGLLVGLLAAAALAGAKTAVGAWTVESFWRSLATTLLLLLLGWSAGRLGKRLRAPLPGAARGGAAEDVAAFGSLGLVPEAAAVARLEEEAARAARHGRPLSLLLVRTTVTAPGVGPETVAAAHRVTARTLEAALRSTDVPFALAPDLVGAVLVETGGDGAWAVAGSVLEEATSATFTDRGARHRRVLGDSADLVAGIATLPEDGRDAASLLNAALAGLEPSRDDEVAS